MKYDLHIHTRHSLCSSLKPDRIVELAKRKGLDGIAITDHNKVEGAIKANKLNKDKDFEVVVGTEVKTNKGDILAYYVNKAIKSRDLFEALDEIKSQGALAVVAHPFRFLPQLRFRYPIEKIKDRVYGVESINSRTGFIGNRQATRLAEKLGLAKIAGSDAHFSFEVGRAYTEFDGSLISAIKKKKTEVYGSSVKGMIGGPTSFSLKLMRKVKGVFKRC
jgi:predicted metal-dependent phosphoesterase TrpH